MEVLKYIDTFPYRKFVVLVDDISRLARDVRGHFGLREAIRRRGVSVESPNFNFEDTPEGEMVEGMTAVTSEYQRKVNRRQVIQKMRARLDSGYWPFGPRTGYKHIRHSQHGVLGVPTESAKEILEEVGLEPCENVEFGIMVETPASVQIIRDICEEGIDFVSFGTNDLTQLTLGVDRNNSLLHFQYNEMHPAILRQIQHVIQVCKEYNVETSICGQAANNPDMAEFLVKAGIDSIAANPDSVIKIRHIVSRVEKKLLLHAARKDFKV